MLEDSLKKEEIQSENRRPCTKNTFFLSDWLRDDTEGTAEGTKERKRKFKEEDCVLVSPVVPNPRKKVRCQGCFASGE